MDSQDREVEVRCSACMGVAVEAERVQLLDEILHRGGDEPIRACFLCERPQSLTPHRGNDDAKHLLNCRGRRSNRAGGVAGQNSIERLPVETVDLSETLLR